MHTRSYYGRMEFNVASVWGAVHVMYIVYSSTVVHYVSVERTVSSVCVYVCVLVRVCVCLCVFVCVCVCYLCLSSGESSVIPS